MGQAPVPQQRSRTGCPRAVVAVRRSGRRAERLWFSLWLRNLKCLLSGPLRKCLQIPHLKEINEMKWMKELS